MTLMKKAFLPLMALFIATSCSNDKSNEPEQNFFDNLEDAYFTVNIVSSNITRTETGSQGTEDGQTNENKIESLILIFTDENNNYLTKSEMIKESISLTESTSFSKTFKVTQTNVEQLKGKKVYYYVIANYVEGDNNDLKDDNLSFTGSSPSLQQTLALSDNEDWSSSKATTYPYKNNMWSDESGFLMSNSEKSSTMTLPSSFDQYKDESNPYPLATVKIQRAMARFDICTDQLESNDINLQEGVSVEFDAVALVNVSKTFFLFKETETSTQGAFALLEPESFGKYVNDPKWINNSEPNPSSFYYPSGSTMQSDMNWVSYSSLNTSAGVVNGDTPNTEMNVRTYKIWTYTTPNTITEASKQKNGVTTGVVFRAKLSPTNIPDMNEGKTVYAYNNVLYGSLTTLENYKINDNAPDAGLKAVLEGIDSFNDENLKAAKFVAYKPSKDQNYYCYYYYWNRHNATASSNGDGKMGIMEYGVVRNNVYKLAVTKVNKLGLPEGSTPNDDDENDPQKDGYFSVSVQVVPWSVRVNDIEF